MIFRRNGYRGATGVSDVRHDRGDQGVQGVTNTMPQQRWPTLYYLLRLLNFYVAAAIAAGMLFIVVAFAFTVPTAVIPKICVAIVFGIAIGVAIGWPLEHYLGPQRGNIISRLLRFLSHEHS